jgi:hypothetical protein
LRYIEPTLRLPQQQRGYYSQLQRSPVFEAVEKQWIIQQPAKPFVAWPIGVTSAGHVIEKRRLAFHGSARKSRQNEDARILGKLLPK